MFFSMLFWAFFEQAGSSMNNFTDRNVDRVAEARAVTPEDVGTELQFRIPVQTNDLRLIELPLLNQEQLGRRNEHPEMAASIERAIRAVEKAKDPNRQLSSDKLAALIEGASSSDTLVFSALTYLREAAARDDANTQLKTLPWRISSENIGMGIGGSEVPASLFQAANPIYILIFGVFFTMLWPFLAERGLDPSTPLKFALGLLQLALGFAALWYGTLEADGRGMVAIFWLLLGYLLHTTGELCSSPIGLSMVTRLSPAQIVSTVMGSWMLAMAFSNYLASVIAKFTGVSHEEGGPQIIPAPIETVHIYGDVFKNITIAALVAALLCFALSPLLTKWMHREVESQ
jgi:proton-dependent oligopeptide transporter, POT family